MTLTLFDKLVLAYLIIINIYVFALMRIDKTRSVRDRRHRIPERRLLGMSAIGGALGGFIAMRMFRHKTKHPSFSVGLPLLLILHIVVVIWLLRTVL
ncbi:DUF1294 domain-containing protein [Paenibacillus lignilyticus]|uniref:DUF1294 domain-containing protein n=1 Tax=Paenibacillus lignilyticus TaxID=1172615 RepID=A0ABS5CGY4_9BACL|nr:DUF1294 domain-containing protein [Paenibacillus lignilyticus]MBP3965145.1 DUF1294 domain-containing protein [Paenibacillus lignilyticus]